MPRVAFIDAVKTFAIFLVCFYHAAQMPYNITDGRLVSYINYFMHGTLSVSVPLFFMAIGYILLPRELDLKKHAVRTGKTYFLAIVWSALMVWASIYFQNKTWTPGQFVWTTMFMENGVNNWIWFMYALVAVYLLYPLTKLAFDQPDKKYIYWFLAVLFIFSFGNLAATWAYHGLLYIRGIHTDSFGQNAVFARQNAVPFGGLFWTNVYVIIGGLLRKDWEIKIRPGYLYGSIAVSFALLFLYGLMASEILQGPFDTVFPEYYSIVVLIASVSVFELFRRYWSSDNKWITSVGDNTLGIYLMHYPINQLVRTFLPLPYNGSFVTGIFFSVFILLLSWSAVLLIRKLPVLRQFVKL